MNSLERTNNKLAGKPVDRFPVHPLFMVYAADLIGVKYSDYVRDHKLLVAGQLAVLEKFEIDLVSCCSDAWREAADCGTQLKFFDSQPPTCERHCIGVPSDLARLHQPDPHAGGRMTDRLNAIRLFSTQVNGQVPILGWVEGPCAEAVDLFGMEPFMLAMADDPQFAVDLMDWVTEMEIRFAVAQVEAGADMIGIGDAAASLVSPRFYAAEVAPREKRIVDAIHAAGATARLHICGTVRGKYAGMESTGADLIDIDFPQSMAEARAIISKSRCLSGNVNPAAQLRFSDPERVLADFLLCREEAGEAYVVAPGCEVPPGTPDENIRAMVRSAV